VIVAIKAAAQGSRSRSPGIISGARDPVVPPANAEFLYQRLPKSKLDFIDAGHFVWEDGADQYAALITSWWGGGYATVGQSRG